MLDHEPEPMPAPPPRPLDLGEIECEARSGLALMPEHALRLCREIRELREALLWDRRRRKFEERRMPDEPALQLVTPPADGLPGLDS
jgi:hypothetical protein